MEKHNAVIKPSYDDRLTNEDLALLKKQTWGTYSFFAFWMSDGMRSLQRFLDYVQAHDQVWICRRSDIARHWINTFPPVNLMSEAKK